jgi:hypothetical protein
MSIKEIVNTAHIALVGYGQPSLAQMMESFQQQA